MLSTKVSENRLITTGSKSIVIAEIPIYGTSQDDYNQFLNNRAEEYIDDCLEASPSRQDIEEIRYYYYERLRTWKYNQIIGYIRLSINKSDVNFEEFISYSKYRRDGNSKENIRFNSDFHFYITQLSNKEIIAEIIRYIELLVKDITRNHPKRYVDTTTFYNIINHLDIVAIVNEGLEEIS